MNTLTKSNKWLSGTLSTTLLDKHNEIVTLALHQTQAAIRNDEIYSCISNALLIGNLEPLTKTKNASHEWYFTLPGVRFNLSRSVLTNVEINIQLDNKRHNKIASLTEHDPKANAFIQNFIFNLSALFNNSNIFKRT